MKAQEIAYRFSLLVCGHADDADDAMQEALLKTYRHAAQIKEPAAFKTWLYRTVKNACLISRRRRVDEPARLQSLDEMTVAPDGSLQRIDAEDHGSAPRPGAGEFAPPPVAAPGAADAAAREPADRLPAGGRGALDP